VTQETPPVSLLQDRKFRNLWAAVELSFLGMFVHVVAGGWLMTALTPSAVLVSLIQTAYALPMVVFSVIAGALADTLDRRLTMSGSLALSLAASSGLALLAFFGLLTPWAILGLIFAVGSGVAIFTPSWQASLGDIVPRNQLVEAVSLHNMGANAMRTVGPSIGGMLIASAGSSVAFSVGAASYLPALLVMLLRPAPHSRGKDREGFRSALELGFRFLAVSPHLQLLLLRVFCFSLGAICVMAMLPLVAKDQFGQGARAYGFLFGGYGLGAILGGLCMKWLRQRFTVDTIVCGAFLITAIAMAALALSTSFWTGLPATVAAGACWLTAHSLQNSVLQLATPRWIVGRMVAMFLSSAFLGLALGGWLWGIVAELFGTQAALGIATLSMLGTFALALRIRLPETAGLDLEPLDTSEIADEQGSALRGGPLYIVIDHQIGSAGLADFLILMEQRRRHLTRLGALHWTLMRDIRNSGRWTESFQTKSWSDYRRMMSRRTAETAMLRQAAVALQQDRVEPAVRLMLRTSATRQMVEPMLRA
jgi:MFS family permease